MAYTNPQKPKEKAELAEMLSYAAKQGRPHKPLTDAELDELEVFDGDLIEVPQGLSSGYYWRGKPRKAGEPGPWRLLSIGPQGWKQNAADLKEWFEGQPMAGEPNPDNWVALRFYKAPYVPATPRSDYLNAGDYAFARMPDQSVILALVADAEGGVPTFVCFPSAGERRPASEVAGKWQKLPERQEVCAVMFAKNIVTFQTMWVFGALVGRRHSWMFRKEMPLAEGEESFEVGDFVCGHLRSDPAGSTRLAKVHSLDGVGRIAELEIHGGEIVKGNAAKKWNRQDFPRAKCQAALDAGGLYKNGKAKQMALKKGVPRSSRPSTAVAAPGKERLPAVHGAQVRAIGAAPAASTKPAMVFGIHGKEWLPEVHGAQARAADAAPAMPTAHTQAELDLMELIGQAVKAGDMQRNRELLDELFRLKRRLRDLKCTKGEQA